MTEIMLLVSCTRRNICLDFIFVLVLVCKSLHRLFSYFVSKTALWVKNGVIIWICVGVLSKCTQKKINCPLTELHPK